MLTTPTWQLCAANNQDTAKRALTGISQTLGYLGTKASSECRTFTAEGTSTPQRSATRHATAHNNAYSLHSHLNCESIFLAKTPKRLVFFQDFFLLPIATSVGSCIRPRSAGDQQHRSTSTVILISDFVITGRLVLFCSYEPYYACFVFFVLLLLPPELPDWIWAAFEKKRALACT